MLSYVTHVSKKKKLNRGKKIKIHRLSCLYQELQYLRVQALKMGVQHQQLGTKAEGNLDTEQKLIKKTDFIVQRAISKYEEQLILTLIGASKDLATLTITGVKNTQKISYTKSPACNSKHDNFLNNRAQGTELTKRK